MAAADSPQHHHPQQPDSNVDLEQVLKSEVARAPFHQFLQQQFCAENINFYLAVEEYKKIPDTERDRRTDFGRQIFDRHFAANCIEPVNIDNSTSNQIREAYKHNRFTVDVYDVVQYQIFHLLKYDCWPRYLRAGGQLAEELGGDAKSHDSGASTSRNAEQCLVVGGGGDHCKSSRRKSLLRFLRIMRAEEGDNGDGDNGVECCECCHHRRRPFGTLNGMVSSSRPSTATAASTRVRSRSPSRRAAQLARRARRSCVEGGGGRGGGGGQSATMTMSLMSSKSVGEHCTCRCRWCRTHSQHKFGEPTFPVRFCTLLCADSATSTEIALSDPFQSVKQWTAMMADNSGLDKSACEVVDAQTGSTIDPVRQAVDALNNRVVRIIPVVKFPVVFLAPTAPCSGTKPTAPPPAKVAILRCRPALTVGKVLRPIMAKYNVDTEQAVVCIAGTCEVLKLQTPVSAIYLKTLAVMSQQQFAERKVLPKREYQKELTLVPPWMTSSASGSSGQSSPGPESPHHPPFHQHGDVGFCELPLEAEGGKLGSGLLKHSATRSYSSNPREFFKFGRKPTMVKSRGAEAESVNAPGTSGSIEASVSTHPGTSSMGTHLRYRKSGGSGMGGGGRNSMAKEADRRKSLGAAASAAAAAGAGTPMDQGGGAGTPTGSTAGGGGRLSSAALAVGLVAPSDIPYCGEVEPPEEPPLAQEMCSTYGVPSMMSRHESVYATKSAVIASSVQQDYPMEGIGGSQEELSRNRGTTAFASVSGANGQPSSGAGPSLPAIFSTAVRSDKDSGGGGISPSPSTDSGAMVWQKADYV